MRGLETNTDEPASTQATAGAPRAATTPARFQPLLLAAGVAAVLPAAADGGAAPLVIAALVALGTAAIGLWVLLRRAVLSNTWRRQTGMLLASVSVAAMWMVMVTDGRQQPEVYFLVAAALVCSLASIHERMVRSMLQLVTVAAVAAALAISGRAMPELVVSVTMILVVALLANLLAGELMTARRSEVAARTDAERRTELLEAVRDLPGSSAEAAVEATVRTLRSLAFDAARVAVLRDGQLHEVGDAGWEAAGEPVPRSEGLMWRAIEEDRTVTSADYQRESARRSVHPDVRSTVVAPIRVARHPIGVVVGGRYRPGEPGAAEVEVAEVLAAHLGVVIDTETRVRRQRELLERMAELDHMRSGFAREVSSELRDPLTIVRTVGEALTRHGDTIDVSRRELLLRQMCDHADDLRQTIDALLDFSRFQASRDEADLVALPLADLLAPVLRSTGAIVEPSLSELRDGGLVVEADVVLARHALEILLIAGVTEVGNEPVASLAFDDRHDAEVRLRVVRRDGTIPSTLVRSLVSQLLVAAGASLADGVDAVVVLRTVPVLAEDHP